jgi:hypothetical protein
MQQAMGPTPPSTPNTAATFRADRAALGQLLLNKLNAVAPPAPPAAAAAVGVVPPRVGGIEIIKGEEYAWTGGSSLAGKRLTEPASMKAYRPQDFKSLQKAEKECQEGLPESHRLSTPDKIISDPAAIPLQTWIKRVKAATEECGMDTQFRMAVSPTEEHYLLDEFGRADPKTVKTWVDTLKAAGCSYDLKNLAMSGKMLLKSLDLDMLKKVERELPVNATGPEVFATVINMHQTLNTSAVRILTEELQKLRLSKEPGENVETFADKVIDIAKRIQGAGPTTCPKDLPTLAYECFQDCTTPMFNLEATALYAKASKGDTSVDDWEANIMELKTTYRACVSRKGWNATKYQKEKAEAQALQAQVKTLTKSLADMTKKGGKTPTGNSGKGSDDRVCFHCQKKGHIKPNCPDKDKPKVTKGEQPAAKGGTSGAAAGAANERKTPPKEGEAHTKTEGADTLKWCGTCKRWNKGEKAHLTAEHVKGKGKSTGSQAAGALAAADDTYDTGASLRLVSGYMAKIGQPVKLGSLTYCGECNKTVGNGGQHKVSFEHQSSKVHSFLKGMQCECEHKCERACEWITVTRKRCKESLKDQAGQH